MRSRSLSPLSRMWCIAPTTGSLRRDSGGFCCRLRGFSRSFARGSGEGEPGSPVLGSDGPGLHALFGPHRAGASEHGRTARPGDPRRLFARGEQLRLLAGRAWAPAHRVLSRFSIAMPIRSRGAIAKYPIAPAEASFNAAFGEFVLPYEAMRQSADPGCCAAGVFAEYV